MYGIYSVSKITGGTVTDSAVGGRHMADIDAGTIDDHVFGTYSIVDIESAVTRNRWKCLW